MVENPYRQRPPLLDSHYRSPQGSPCLQTLIPIVEALVLCLTLLLLLLLVSWSLVSGYHCVADPHCCHDHCPCHQRCCPHSSLRPLESWSLVTADADWKIETERAWLRGWGLGRCWADCWGREGQEAVDRERGLVPGNLGSREARPDPALTAEGHVSCVRPRMYHGEAPAASDQLPSRGQASSHRPCPGGRAASCPGTGPFPGDKAGALARDQALAYPDLQVDSPRVLAYLDGASCTCQPCLDAASGQGRAYLGVAGIPGVRDI